MSGTALAEDALMMNPTLALAIAVSPPTTSAHAELVRLPAGDTLRIEGRANTFLGSRQHAVALTGTEDGGFALAWESRRQHAGAPGVRWRLFDRTGRPIGNELPTAASTRAPQSSPSLVWTRRGAVAAYESQFRSGMESAACLGDAVLELRPGGEHVGVVASIGPDGRGLAVWRVSVGAGKERLRARMVDADGRPTGAAFWLDQSSDRQAAPSVAWTERGVVAVWQRLDEVGRSVGVFGRIVDGKTAQVVRIAGPAAIEPTVAAGGDRVAVSYHAPTGTGEHRARLALLDSDLAPVASAIEAQGLGGDASGASVAVDEAGDAFVAWNRRKDDERDVVGRFVRRDGALDGPAFVVTRQTAGEQRLTEVSGAQRISFSEGRVVVAWSGEGGLGDSSGAHYTVLVPRSEVTSAELADALAWKPEAPATALAHEPQLRLDRKIVAVATPHDPPVFTPPSQRGGRTEYPMFNGGFNAFTPTSFTPPDPDIAVGLDHVVAVVNDGIAFYTKAGAQTYINNMRFTNGFWGNLAASDNFIYDPETFFDPQTGRFFVMATQGAGGTQDSAALVGVSDDGDPNGTWFLYRFLTTSLAGNFFDSPNFGVDANVLYVTGDGFGSGSTYPVFCIEKAPLLSGGTPVIRSAALPTSTQSAGIPDVVDLTEPAYYMVEHKEAATNNAIDVIAVRTPLTTPTFTRFTLSVPSYTSPPEDPPQSGTTTRPEAFDARFWSVKYQNGRLWATHHVGSTRVLARWYEIALNGWPTSGQNPSLVQSGNADLGTTVRTSFTSVAADVQGNAALVYARSSPTEFFSMARSSRRFDDATGLMPATSIDRTATGAYTTSRWGDYSGVEADPFYPGLFWGHHEWAEGASWRTWVQPYRVTDNAWATGLSLFRGISVSGNARSLLKTDSQELVVRKGLVGNASEAPVQIDLSTRSSLASPGLIRFAWRHRVNAAGLVQIVEAFDWNQNAFVEIDRWTANQAATDVQATFTNPARFVRAGTREMRVRLKVQPNGPVSVADWQSLSDRAIWIVN